MNQYDKENRSLNVALSSKREPLSIVNKTSRLPLVLKTSVQGQILPQKHDSEKATKNNTFDIYIDNEDITKETEQIKNTAKGLKINATKSTQQAFTVYRDSFLNESTATEDENDIQINSNCVQQIQESDEANCSNVTICTSPQYFERTIPDSPMIVVEEKDLSEKECPVLEYSEITYNYLRKLEQKNRPKCKYMDRQPDITQSMRTILIDWLIEVCEEYKMDSETLFLSVSYIDRFLSIMSVQRTKLQLVGSASLFIASKYEEIYPPELSEFVYITDDTYTKSQFLRMEHLIIKTLSFDLAVPTINYFVQRLAFFTKVSSQIKNLAKYLCELSLLDGDVFMNYLPSEIASSSLALANYTFGLDPWPIEFQEMSGYYVPMLNECIIDLHNIFENAKELKFKAVVEKYKSHKYDAVSHLSPPPLSKQC